MKDFLIKDWYGQIMNHIVDVVSVFDLNLNYVFISKSMEKFLGYAPEELIGKNLRDVLTERSYNLAIKLFKEELEKEKDPSIDKDRNLTLMLETTKKNGETILVEVNVSALRDENEEIKYILAVSRDITDRVMIQKKLEESETKFRTIFNSTNDAIFIHDATTGEILDVNEPMLKMYGYSSKDEIIGKDITTVSSDISKQNLALSLIKKAAKGIPQVFEWEAKKKNGKTFWVEVALTKASCTDRDIVIAVVRDINKRKTLEQQLKEQVDLFTTLADVAFTAIAIFNGEKFLYANKAVYDITGYSKEDFSSRPPYFCVHPDYRDIVKQRVEARLKGAILPNKYEIKIITKQGEEKWIELTAGRIVFKGKPAIIGSCYDITEFKNTQQQLVHEKEKLSLLLRSVQDVIITTDLNGVVTYINKAGVKLLNLRGEDIIGKPLDSVLEFKDVNSISEIKNPVLKSIEEKKTTEGYNVSLMVKKNNKVIDIEFNASPIKDREGNISGCVLVIRDVTEKQKFLQAIQNAQKLESLGTLAAGIAHDFNNLLGGIYGFIDLALMKAKDKRIVNYLKKSIQTLERARHLTNQLLTFASGGEPVKKENVLDEFLKDTVQFALSGSSVKANLVLEKNIVCSFDENQLAQAIDNIVINGLEAMNYKGEIDVELKRICIPEFNKSNIPPGEYAEIKIKDRGVGIPKNILSNIFDPFFTTKQKGHGLGLAIAYSIVKKHGGEIVVESKPGKGTTFFIYLPCVKNVSSIVTSNQDESSHKDLSGNGTIIVLEDEEVLQELLENTLTDLGFNVILKKNGEELVEFIENADEKIKSEIKAIFFDLVIVGGMGGMEAAQKIKKYIDVPFIVMSGYSSDPVISNPKKYGFVASLKKPFKIKDVIEVVKKYFI